MTATKSKSYEVYVKPEKGINGGPCTVHERDTKGNWCWVDKDEAIKVAKNAKVRYSNMDFIVHEEVGFRGPKSVVYDTSCKQENS